MHSSVDEGLCTNGGVNEFRPGGPKSHLDSKFEFLGIIDDHPIVRFLIQSQIHKRLGTVVSDRFFVDFRKFSKKPLMTSNLQI